MLPASSIDAEVTGVQPAVGVDGGRGRFGHAEVVRHLLRRALADLPDGADGHGSDVTGSAIFTSRPGFGRPMVRALMSGGSPVNVCRDAYRLALPVGDEELDAERRLDVADGGLGHSGAATEHDAEGREPSGSNSGWRCRSYSMVGTAARTVAPVASTRRITAVGSYAGRNPYEAPTVRLASRPPIVPATWWSGSGPTRTSSGPCPHPCTKLAAMFTAASCVMTAPFGRPGRPGRVLDEDRERRVVGDRGVRGLHECFCDEGSERREVGGSGKPVDDGLQPIAECDPPEGLRAEHEAGSVRERICSSSRSPIAGFTGTNVTPTCAAA